MSETLARPQLSDLELQPRLEDYARRPIEEAYDMPAVLQTLGVEGGYLVEFESQRRPEASENLINTRDNAAHIEAAASPGFLFYNKGHVDSEGYSKSFCLWLSVEEGRAASSLPAHVAAVSIAPEVYESFKLQRRFVYLDPNRSHGVSFEEVFPAMEMSFK